MQLVRLKKIFISGYYFRSKLLMVVNDVVLRNASTLTLLHMGSELRPFDPNRPVVFSNLRDLECSLMVPEETACPRLVKLRTSITVKGLQELPAETLTSLCIDRLAFGFDMAMGSPNGIEQLVAAFSRFTRLRSIMLVDGFRFFPADWWTDQHDRPFSKLFTNMKELEEVDITFPDYSAVSVDTAIETLVHNSPSVRSIRMIYAGMTDAGLHSLSRLTGLQRLVIRSYRRISLITTEGILSLLRGGSRNVLRILKLNMSVSPDFDQIRAEVEHMREETGRTFTVEAGSVPSAEIIIYTLRIYSMTAEAVPDLDSE